MQAAYDHGSAPRFIDVGHSEVAHYRHGNGPPVLFVHGWPLHGATFRKLVPVLSRRFTCHVIDLPGTGASRWDERSRMGIIPHVETLRAVIGALGLRDYGIVSHDSGGVLARLVAAADASVRALVVSGSEIPGHRPLIVEL